MGPGGWREIARSVHQHKILDVTENLNTIDSSIERTISKVHHNMHRRG